MDFDPGDSDDARDRNEDLGDRDDCANPGTNEISATGTTGTMMPARTLAAVRRLTRNPTPAIVATNDGLIATVKLAETYPMSDPKHWQKGAEAVTATGAN